MRDKGIQKLNHFNIKIVAILACLFFLVVIAAQANDNHSVAHIVINEVEQNPPDDDRRSTTMEWVELYNPTSSNINLNGWTLSTTGGKRTHTFTIDGTIKANGYFVYDHSRWLDNEDESVILRDTGGNEIDRTPLLEDKKNDDRSWQRYPNGFDTDFSSDWKFRSSTKGYSNSGPEPTPFPSPTPSPTLTPSPTPTSSPSPTISPSPIPSPSSSPSPTPALSTWYSICFTPDNECEQYMMELIKSANSSVYAALYDIKLKNVSDALIDAYCKRSVDVKIVMDDKCANHTDSMYPELAEFGIVKTDFKPSDFMHNKFIVVDNRTVWTGSMNPTPNGAYYNNNNVIVINSTELASDYTTEFFEMWNGMFSAGSPANTPYPVLYINETEIECYFAPEDGVEAQIIDELKRANHSVYFATFTFTSKPIAQALIDLQNKGVEVKGIYERRQNSTYCTYHLLHDAGIEVTWDKNPKTMHHKFFIIDNTTTITGSYNPTKHANTANDENILIIHNENISDEYVNEFYEMWNEWQPTSSAGPTMTPSITPPSSYTSVPGFDLATTTAGLLAVAYTLMKREKYDN